MQKIIVSMVASTVIGVVASPLFAAASPERQVAPRINDREIIERLTRLEEGQRQLVIQMNQRFEAVNQRFEAVDQRFETINQQFAELHNFMRWGFGVMFAGIFTLMGFVIWDRRTALSPAIAKTRELEEREERIEKVFKVLAENDPRVADAMRHIGLR